MRLRLRSSVLSLVGCAVLAFHAGCATTSQSTPSDDTASTPPKEEPVKPSSGTTPSTGSSSWQRARVGDGVAYSFSVNRAPGRAGGTKRALAGQLVLEVVAVQQPWVWLKLSFTDDAGKPLANPLLARELLLPMRMDASRPLEVPREGTESVEQPSAAGRTWEAKRYVRDNRPSDGPLENRLYAVSPGPLYLTNGLLDASTTLSGFGDNGGAQLTLVEVRQGKEGGTATVPALERPLGPGTWYDVRMSMPGSNSVQRTCLSAEQGYLLRAQEPAPSAGGTPCASFAEAEVVPLEENLLGLLSEAINATSWPPPTVAPTSRGTFTAEGHSVPALTFETPESEGTTRRVRYETYAADPWEPSLAGLAHEARFRALTEGLDRLDAKGKRESEAASKLTGWGVWAGSGK